ncbi:prolyl oligopeptidase family serine peptidase [Streptomyces sp. NPDC058001]|uniref:prolyl oligopeptidase family serine peptidase n=1 Tax=Streptomyces sp. NPDC058001 TaxID=3346300 RepID=UPI0036EDE6B2
MPVTWQQYFHARRFLTLRRGRGEEDLELVVTDTEHGPGLALWDVARDELRYLEGDFGDVQEAVLTSDGRAALVLRDEHGSEVGHVWHTPLDGTAATDLTPDLPPYVLRGIDVARSSTRIALTAVSSEGFRLLVTDSERPTDPSVLYSSANEAWNGLIAADGRFASVDTTDHNPGVRRFAVTVVGVEDPGFTATLSDGPDAPVRGVRFSPVPGDPRVLVSTERGGYARPCVWNPVDGSRVDVEAPGLRGDVVALDWSPGATRVLAVHVDAGVHRVMEFDLTTGALTPVPHPDGAYFEPDVAAAHLNIWASHYGADDEIRLLRQRFDLPLSMLRIDRSGTRELSSPLTGPAGPAGTPLRSLTVTSTDGTDVQLWAARPPGATEPGPLVLYLHGGPNMVTVDRFSPDAQAWLADGVAYAALNYRGSVTFGRDFREGFLGTVGDRETEDIEAAVRRLVDDGYARKDQIFVTGVSYGGFLTLLSLGRLPELFAGGLAFVPMADWVTGYRDMNPALRPAWRGFIGGTPEEVPDRYRHSSPITYVDQVRAPVWISQATYDTRTPPAQVYGYARALEATGGDVSVDWYTGGHETTSRTRSIAEHTHMTTLVKSALTGARWSHSPVTPPERTT